MAFDDVIGTSRGGVKFPQFGSIGAHLGHKNGLKREKTIVFENRPQYTGYDVIEGPMTSFFQVSPLLTPLVE